MYTYDDRQRRVLSGLYAAGQRHQACVYPDVPLLELLAQGLLRKVNVLAHPSFCPPALPADDGLHDLVMIDMGAIRQIVVLLVQPVPMNVTSACQWNRLALCDEYTKEDIARSLDYGTVE
jgi:hypothetical protein